MTSASDDWSVCYGSLSQFVGFLHLRSFSGQLFDLLSRSGSFTIRRSFFSPSSWRHEVARTTTARWLYKLK